MSLDMLAYMKNHLEAHPFDLLTPSCDPQSGLLVIFHSGPILAKMNISGFDMICTQNSANTCFDPETAPMQAYMASAESLIEGYRTTFDRF